MSQPQTASPLTPLAGKTALITGASRTLGANIALTMAQQGVDIIVNYLNAETEAEAVCAEIRELGREAFPIKADVSRPEDVERLVETSWSTWGRIDILINNVGPYVDTPFLEMPLADFDQILATNIRATFLMSQKMGLKMKAQGKGHIINLAATDIFHYSHSVYGLAKTGVIYLTKAMALELAPEVQVNALAPDLIADNEGMAADFVARTKAGTPLGRLVTRQEIAEVICQLCSPSFAILTGQTIVLDGGRSIPRIRFGE